MNFIKKFIGSTPTDEVVSLPSGKLFLTRSPYSPKGELECLYNDAFASIRQTSSPFFYRLVITRVYQEGELSSQGGSGFDDSDEEDEFNDHDLPHSITDSASGTGHSKDEYGFAISEELKIHLYDKEDGTKAISWKDLNGDIGDRFEFIVDSESKQQDVDNFMFAVYKCQYEEKYHKSSLGVTSKSQLKEFFYNPTSELLTFEDLNKDLNWDEEEDEDDEDEDEPSRSDTRSRSRTRPAAVGGATKANSTATNTTITTSKQKVAAVADSDSDSDPEFHDAKTGDINPAITRPLVSGTPVFQSNDIAELYVYNPDSEEFKLDSKKPVINVLEGKDWTSYLTVKRDDGTIIEAKISRDLTPTFNYEYFSFVFNYTSLVSVTSSYLLKFPDFNSLSNFQNIFTTQLWQGLNKSKFSSVSKPEMEYVIDAFSKAAITEEDLTPEELKYIEGISDDDMDVDDDKEFLEAEKEVKQKSIKDSTQRKVEKLFVDSDDEYDDNQEEKELQKFNNESGQKNSNLAVGISNDRSYVVRGDKLGVFKNSDEDLSYQTTISNVSTLDGKKFVPKNTMLHQQDRYLVMQNPDIDENKLFKMDLERGKIIEEWEVSKDQQLKSYAPNSKFAQLTDEQTLTGVSANGMFKIDPRLSSTAKLVNDNTFKLYKTKNNDFSSLATTQQGYVAVGSKRGDIRLYDRLGINAKTALPSLGEPIKGIDVSADGRWLLATCETYLLLIDNKIGSGQRNEGNIGFLKSFDSDKKPKPRRLTLKPEHVAFMYGETGGKPLSFTKAHFNTGLDTKESVIVTSSGPYVITWSLKKLLQPVKRVTRSSAKEPEEPYLIKRFRDNVIADNFKYGSNASVILASQNDVAMQSRSGFQKPTKSFFHGANKNNIVENF